MGLSLLQWSLFTPIPVMFAVARLYHLIPCPSESFKGFPFIPFYTVFQHEQHSFLAYIIVHTPTDTNIVQSYIYISCGTSLSAYEKDYNLEILLHARKHSVEMRFGACDVVGLSVILLYINSVWVLYEIHMLLGGQEHEKRNFPYVLQVQSCDTQ